MYNKWLHDQIAALNYKSQMLMKALSPNQNEQGTLVIKITA